MSVKTDVMAERNGKELGERGIQGRKRHGHGTVSVPWALNIDDFQLMIADSGRSAIGKGQLALGTPREDRFENKKITPLGGLRVIDTKGRLEEQS
jgi:hypothetical protein